MDSNTSTELDAEIRANIESIKCLVFDLGEMSYISSAGLRVLLFACKVMRKQGEMYFRNVQDDVMEIFNLTGMDEFFVFE